MNALILVDHGSRRAEANEHLETIAARVQRTFPGTVFAAHMEIAKPSLADAVARALSEGAEDIVVVPFFLSPGRHVTGDIPRLVEEARASHPGTRIRLAAHLGDSEHLSNLVLERAANAS